LIAISAPNFLTHVLFFPATQKMFIQAKKPRSTVKCDFAVIGAGVVGLAVARNLALRGVTLLIEKHPIFGMETSSRNSEVIHSGLYYPHSSLKTKLCISGQRMLYDYLGRKNISFNRCGKWIVAQQDQLDELQALKEKIDTLGISNVWRTGESCRKIEPLIKSFAALEIPNTGVFDSHSFMGSLETDFINNGGICSYNTKVCNIEKHTESITVIAETGKENIGIEAPVVINCAGLYSDKISNMVLDEKFAYHYCKGHYYRYSGPQLAKRLIYPLPDRNLTSLGLHLTLDLTGAIKFGPDVYYQDNCTDYSFMVSDEALSEVYREISRYVHIDQGRLHQDYTGIRPKLAAPGEGFRDFEIIKSSGFISLLGIESPGLTSSLAIAEYVSQLI
jgi:L-2-hydroxyglutarate oxidase LhgO